MDKCEELGLGVIAMCTLNLSSYSEIGRAAPLIDSSRTISS